MIEYVKVEKNGTTKSIQKKDLAEYIAMGWREVNQGFDFPKTQIKKLI